MRADPVQPAGGRDSPLFSADGAPSRFRAPSPSARRNAQPPFGKTMLFYPHRPARWVRAPGEGARHADHAGCRGARPLRSMKRFRPGPTRCAFTRYERGADAVHDTRQRRARSARGAGANRSGSGAGALWPAAKDRPFSTVVGTIRSPAASHSRRESRSRRCRRTPGSVLAALGMRALRLAVLDAPGKRQLRERRTALERDCSGRCSPL